MDDAGAQAGPSTQTALTEPYQMRITDHGKINLFVSFALKFLEENPQRPLVFHTFPSNKAKSNSKPREEPSTDALPNGNNEAENLSTVEPPRKKRRLATATTTIPRLVTVIEIVKREYGKWAAARKTEDGSFVEDSLRAGLHQYNELSCLEDLGLINQQDQNLDDAEQLQMALEGKNFLKQKFTPHLKVTLSVSALPGLEEKGATHQPPPPPAKVSKSAKARQRRRQKKNETEGMSLAN